ncbi:MAG: methyltransferase domain-containing protein [Candidatus Rokuibacteriota bacterium]
MALHPDPYRDLDAQADAARFVEALEMRGRTPIQARLRRRFLRFVPVHRGDRVLEVGCGSGVIVRDLTALVGRRGRVVGVDVSRVAVAMARRLARGHPRTASMTFRVGDGMRLPYRDAAFDTAIAVTVLLHAADPLRVVKEMARVVRARGRVGLQDQDFGTVAAAHPDAALTDLIFDGVTRRIYEERYSGRRLPALLRAAGLERVRLLTDVYQDTTLAPYTKSFLERRAENAVRFGIVEAPAAQRWLDGFTALVAQGSFVFTMNYYGAAGVKAGA